MDYFTAKGCFYENMEVFGDPKTQPEKYNLYRGLDSLAKAIETDMAEIKRQLNFLRDFVQTKI